MVCLVYFGYNVQMVGNNVFQINDLVFSLEEISVKVKDEFDVFVSKFCVVGVQVIVIDDMDELFKYDVVFFNNWFFMYIDGVIIIYLMYVFMCWQECWEDVISKL